MKKIIASFIKRLLVYVKQRHRNLIIHGSCSLNSQFGGENYIGRDSYFEGKLGYAANIGNHSEIYAEIGNFTCIGSNVKTIIATHPLYPFASINPVFYSIRDKNRFSFVKTNKYKEYKLYNDRYGVSIGNDVWIGSNVILMGGIKIGDGAVVAAGAVVTKDVEPYSIVAGVPAKFIRKRFNDNDVEFLNSIQWWNWPVDKIRKYADCFSDIRMLKKKIDGV